MLIPKDKHRLHDHSYSNTKDSSMHLKQALWINESVRFRLAKPDVHREL